MKGEREKYLSELWDKHFIKPVMFNDLSATVKDVATFEKKTRDTLKLALNLQETRISSSSANNMILLEALAVITGTSRYLLVSSLLQTNPYAIVISIITDFIVYAGISHILEGELRIL